MLCTNVTLSVFGAMLLAKMVPSSTKSDKNDGIYFTNR